MPSKLSIENAFRHSQNPKNRKRTNDISNKNIGFGSDFNEVIILSDGKKEKIPRIKKSLLADKIVERVISQLN